MTATERRSSIGLLLLWIGLCLGAAVIGGLGTARGLPQWYPALHKPSWTPPDHVFGPVWTALYLMMAAAAWLISRDRTRGPVTLPLLLFVNQLFLNAIWPLLFFGFHRLGLAWAELTLLWLLVAATTLVFWRRQRLAGALLLPYWLWISFAWALNLAIWRLNS